MKENEGGRIDHSRLLLNLLNKGYIKEIPKGLESMVNKSLSQVNTKESSSKFKENEATREVNPENSLMMEVILM